MKSKSIYVDFEFFSKFNMISNIMLSRGFYIDIQSNINRVVIREGPGRTPGVSPSTRSGQRGEVPL